MTRRQFLAACWALALVPALAAKKDPRVSDYLLEKELVRAQQVAFEAGEIYRKWRDGGDTPPAKKELASCIVAVAELEKRARAQVLPVSAAALRSYCEGVGDDLRFLLTDVTRTRDHVGQTELQQRWRVSVKLQRRLINLRRAQLSTLTGEFYTWKSRLLDLQLAELALAGEMASALAENKGAPDLEARAVELYKRVSALDCPSGCQAARQAYLDRFTALRGICEELAGTVDADVLSNLKACESRYRRSALECEERTLKIQAKLLGVK